MFDFRGVFRNFFKEGAPILRHFFKRSFFPAELILSNLGTKNDSRGVRGNAPPKNFKNLHTVMAILLLFEQLLGKVCHIFSP